MASFEALQIETHRLILRPSRSEVLMRSRRCDVAHVFRPIPLYKVGDLGPRSVRFSSVLDVSYKLLGKSLRSPMMQLGLLV
jgi:hypothetical protein